MWREFIEPLVPSLVLIALAVVGALVAWGRVKEAVNTNKSNIAGMVVSIGKLDENLRKFLFGNNGISIYIPRREFIAHCDECKGLTCAKLDKIDSAIMVLGRERAEDMRTTLNIVKEQAEFIGSVKQFMENVKFFMEEEHAKRVKT